jgi:FAD synthase
VECVQRIRGEKKFLSSEELVEEMNNDKRIGKNILENV